MKLANISEDPPELRIYSFGHEIVLPERANNKYSNSVYIDARPLKSVKVGIANIGTDVATRRKFVNHPDIRDFYEQHILFPVREKVNEYTVSPNDPPEINVYIGCHQGKHKSVCLAEKLRIDMKRRCEKVTVQHLTLHK